MVLLACDIAKAVVANKQRLEDCAVITSDYCHPSCNHIIPKPKCCDKRRYEANPPQCATLVAHRAPCGCVTEMTCAMSLKEMAKPSACKKSREFARPRCHHRLSLRCHIGEELKAKWEEQEGEAMSLREGQLHVLLIRSFNATLVIY